MTLIFRQFFSHVWTVSTTECNQADSHKGLILNGTPQPLWSFFRVLSADVMLQGLSGISPLWCPHHCALSKTVNWGFIGATWGGASFLIIKCPHNAPFEMGQTCFLISSSLAACAIWVTITDCESWLCFFEMIDVSQIVSYVCTC